MLTDITVTIPTFTRVTLLQEALASVFRQDYKGPITILVINDQPRQVLSLDPVSIPDGMSVRIINIKQLFPSLGAKRDWLLQHVNTKWVTFLDDDDLWMPWHLHSMFAGAPDTCWAIFPKEEFRHELQRWSYGPVPGGLNIAVDTAIAKQIGFDHDLNVGEDNAFRNSVLAMCGNNIHRPANPGRVYRIGTGSLHISRSLKGVEVDRDRFIASAAAKLNAGDEPHGKVLLAPIWRRDYLAEITRAFPEVVPKEHQR